MIGCLSFSFHHLFLLDCKPLVGDTLPPTNMAPVGVYLEEQQFLLEGTFVRCHVRFKQGKGNS